MAGLGHWYVELEKQAWWRGANVTWVNRYVMSGVDPSAADALSVIFDLYAIENEIHPAAAGGLGVGFVQGRAYSGSGGSFFAHADYNPSKVPSSATGFSGLPGPPTGAPSFGPLEGCLMVESQLQGVSSRGKPTYLRKYIRGWQYVDPIGSSDGQVPSAIQTQVNSIASPWHTGMGSSSWVVIGVSGKQTSSYPVTKGYLVNRQKPRGRKKKVTATPAAVAAAFGRLTLLEQADALAREAIGPTSGIA